MNRILVALLAALLVPGAAFAQAWPSKPIRMIVPYGPGGSTDLTGRVIGEKLQQALGVSIVVENRAGASGQIGAAEAAKAAPDGYTLLVGAPQIVVLNPLFFKDMRYDAVNGFSPISIAILSPNYIMVHPETPVHSIRDLIGWAKANPGKVFFASSGFGSTGHLTGLLLNKLGGIDMAHIGYKGSAGAVTEVIAGRVPVLVDQPVPGIAQVRAGKLRAIGVGTTTRVPALPEVPTVMEQGVADFESATWFGFFAPRGTPQPILDRLTLEVQKAMKLADVQSKFVPSGYVPVGLSQAESAARIEADRKKWTALAVEAGVKPQ
ncbi:MAG TPA: tripartite tricarboxylate transporter substrate binding protein [Burkholderiales bacterium]